MRNLILLSIIIVSLVIAIVLSIISSSKAKNHKDTEASNYSIAASVFIGVAILTLAVGAFLYLRQPSGVPVDINTLVDDTTAALGAHVNEINKHATIINNALGKMSGVSTGLNKTCDSKFTCKSF